MHTVTLFIKLRTHAHIAHQTEGKCKMQTQIVPLLIKQKTQAVTLLTKMSTQTTALLTKLRAQVQSLAHQTEDTNTRFAH